MFFPTLFDSPAARISAFVDFGNVFKDVDAFDADELRVSTGIALMWRAPVGPISISYAFPLRKGDDDELERLRSAEHTSELQSLMRISYAVFCLKKKNQH